MTEELRMECLRIAAQKADTMSEMLALAEQLVNWVRAGPPQSGRAVRPPVPLQTVTDA